ncbi:hypothetical protein [Paenibacillus koleovorans]|uniref:hypothetical protein n=1 Tax=Paenibacillus koleovorans TaxID=121608 RepID=UPI000FD9FA47|nr:hypothetical protein [Paenibacillus koleovorans]
MKESAEVQLIEEEISQEELTLKHALSKNSVSALKDLIKVFDAIPIDPKASKPELINNLVPSIPKESISVIIDKAFNPKIRYTAFVASFDSELPTNEEFEERIVEYNTEYDYNHNDLLKNGHIDRSYLEYHQKLNNELIFILSAFRKILRFDPEARESTPSTSLKKIRITVNENTKLITVYTGNKDYFEKALIAMYKLLGKSVKAVSINLSGVLPSDTQEFSFPTVKILDYIYHGLTRIGKIGLINAVELDTPSKSKNPQTVKVKGDDLLTDEVICKYLFIHKRDLVGIRTHFTFVIEENEYPTSIELLIKDDRIKIGIKKENYSFEQLDLFFGLIQKNINEFLRNRGLINSMELQKILSRLSTLAVK